MIETRVVTEDTTKITAYICDRCVRRVSIEDSPMEAQELFHWRHACGYGSVWGDGTTIACDLCQQCTLEVLGPFVRKSEMRYV